MTAIRPARASDVDAISAVQLAAIHTHGPDAYDEREVAAWAASDELPRERYDLGEGHWVVAERAGGVVGMGQLDPDAGEVIAVYVHPDHARAGVGSAILAELEEYARGVGCATLTLVASLNAVAFYERAGYERREAVTHETSTGVELDCVKMGKEL